MKPYEAKTFEKICKLERDNIETSSGFALFLTEEGAGLHLPSGEWINIPSEDFEQLARWYIEGKEPSHD